MKIKFISNAPNLELSISPTGKSRPTAINPAYFYIKAYYMLHGKNPNVEWLPCDFVMFDSLNDQANNILADNPDIVAMSVYVWNEDFQFALAKELKQRNPNLLLVLGGPQLAVHKDPTWFEKHPYVDFVGYGDGEQAFQLLIDRYSGFLPADTPLINMVENLKPGYKLWPYEMISDEKYLSTSSFLIQKEEVASSIDYMVSRGLPKNNILFAIEFARGCMYSCAFCDWSQNLTKKVKRRTHDWKEELHFFRDLDIKLRETDANFGQWKEDVEVFDYACELYRPDRNFQLRIYNTPKLKKDVTFYIQTKQAKLFGFRMIVSLQDINEEVLQNINRPSISWEEHKVLIKKMLAIAPEKQDIMAVQLIIGLPGQTYDSIVEMLCELYRTGVRFYDAFAWTYLENSPAADTMYQKIHKLKWMDVYFPNAKTITVDSIEETYKTLATGVYDPNSWIKMRMVVGHKSMGLREMMKAQLWKQYFESTIRARSFDTEDELQKFKIETTNRVNIEVDKTLDQTSQLIDTYNIVIYGITDGNTITTIFYQ
jgi:radical SAM superfamily enzyme YgiQ (UPF0313 family)